MDEGYILSNKYRRAVFDELAAGEGNIQRIAKKHRLILTVVRRVIEEFEAAEIVKHHQGRYVFTEKGERLKQSM
ncbi:MAG: hypothetical protein KKG04_04410 [Candidatus Thermoplasmatota archaeon]|nr:hypothetical protein [Candidatus Thermoplasmatota archaeon]